MSAKDQVFRVAVSDDFVCVVQCLCSALVTTLHEAMVLVVTQECRVHQGQNKALLLIIRSLGLERLGLVSVLRLERLEITSPETSSTSRETFSQTLILLN